MKKIGLIGGTGPQSTLLYYKELNRIISEKTDGKKFPEIVIDSLDLFAVLPLIKEKKYDELIECLSSSASRLVKAGAQAVAFSAVTCHIVSKEVAALCPVKMIGIPQAVGSYSKAKGYKKVGLLGTIFTMDSDYLTTPVNSYGVEVVVPNQEDKEIVNEIIYSELEFGNIKKESVDKLIKIIERMKTEQAIEAIILGCTELPLAINNENSPVECIDVVKVHIDKLVETIMEEVE